MDLLFIILSACFSLEVVIAAIAVNIIIATFGFIYFRKESSHIGHIGLNDFSRICPKIGNYWLNIGVVIIIIGIICYLGCALFTYCELGFTESQNIYQDKIYHYACEGLEKPNLNFSLGRENEREFIKCYGENQKNFSNEQKKLDLIFEGSLNEDKEGTLIDERYTLLYGDTDEQVKILLYGQENAEKLLAFSFQDTSKMPTYTVKSENSEDIIESENEDYERELWGGGLLAAIGICAGEPNITLMGTSVLFNSLNKMLKEDNPDEQRKKLIEYPEIKIYAKKLDKYKAIEKECRERLENFEPQITEDTYNTLNNLYPFMVGIVFVCCGILLGVFLFIIPGKKLSKIDLKNITEI